MRLGGILLLLCLTNAYAVCQKTPLCNSSFFDFSDILMGVTNDTTTLGQISQPQGDVLISIIIFLADGGRLCLNFMFLKKTVL